MGAQSHEPLPRAWPEPVPRLCDHGVTVRVAHPAVHHHVHHPYGLCRDGAWPEVFRHQRLRGRVSWDDYAGRHRGEQCNRAG